MEEKNENVFDVFKGFEGFDINNFGLPRRVKKMEEKNENVFDVFKGFEGFDINNFGLPDNAFESKPFKLEIYDSEKKE